MTSWAPFGVQRTTGAAVFCSVTMHALVLLVLTQYSMRPQTPLNLDKQNLHPPIEVLLISAPMATLDAMTAKAVTDPAAHPSVNRTRQRITQTLPQAKLPLPSREAHSETVTVKDATQDIRVAGTPSDAPNTASKAVAGASEQSRSDRHSNQLGSANVDRPPEQQPIQGAHPDYAYNPQPDYPLLLREQGVGGVVWLRVWVDSEGRPVEIKLAKGSGYRLLDDAALRAVKQWRFIPAKNGEQRLASWVEFPIRFTLNS